MPDLTLQAIEKLLDTKLEPVKTTVADLVEDMREMKTDVKAIKQTVGSHSASLDGIANDVKKLLDEKTVTTQRLDHLEHWAQLVSAKLGIKLEL